MQQVFLEKGKAIIRNVSEPLLDPHSVAIQVHYSFISTGTEHATLTASATPLYKKALKDITKTITKIKTSLQEHGLNGTLALINGLNHQSLEIGYSCAGQVIALGAAVKKLQIGDFVSAGGSGLAHHAEIVMVPEHLIAKVENPAQLKEASITTIGAIALQGLRRADLRIGEKVCIVGLGLLGQLTVQLAKLSGLFVVGLDLDSSRCALAKENGADLVINVAQEHAITTATFATEHHGFDATIITAASQEAPLLQQAVELTRRKGKVVLVGDTQIKMDRDPLYQKEIDFLISCSYGPGRYDQDYERKGIDYPYAYVRWTEQRNMQFIADLISQKKLQIASSISAEYPLEKIEEAYDNLFSKKHLGILLSYQQTETNVYEKTILPATSQEIKQYQYPEQTINVAMVGVGGFTKTKLLPLIQQISEVKIGTIIDTNITAAINIARQLGNIPYHNDYESLLKNDQTNAVVLATPHGLHATQTIALLKAGKAVFAEKPAAVTFEQLKLLQQTLTAGKMIYTVDFNRSFAPFIQKIYSVTRNRSMPLILSYRMNAGYLPQDHWIQSPLHKGRIIGEACHIIDLFLYLIEADPVNLQVTTLGKRADLQQSDNVSVQLLFADGSQAHFLYVATGNTELAKERMEVFFEGKSIVMDDYTDLKGYGLHPSFNEKQCVQNKGHNILLHAFFNYALHPQIPAPIPHKRIITTTALSILINDLAMQGGGEIRLTKEDLLLDYFAPEQVRP
jgi:predicted dehydrogenase/threonine dehydrogenase-like Zn-dependent dehydrogenase